MDPAYEKDEGKWLDVARELYEAMSDLSEEVWCAGWMRGWEYALWNFAMNHPSKAMRSRMAIGDGASVAEIAHVMDLSMQCDGWIIWDHENGATWIPIDDWYWHLVDPKNRPLDGKGIALK
jgi:hypothetical protein